MHAKATLILTERPYAFGVEDVVCKYAKRLGAPKVLR